MKKCDYRFEGGSSQTPKHDGRMVGTKHFAPQPALGTDKAASIRKEQTRYMTKPEKSFHKDQFANEKPRRRTLPR